MPSATTLPAPTQTRDDRSGRVLVSVVFSFRNEAEVLATLVARLDAVFSQENVQYELIFVNDASTDRSLDVLMAERSRNPRIKILTMSRRFGVGECQLAGLEAASGDAVIYMDTDLQDPPEVIPQLLARWRSGADVVHTVRTKRRGENALKMWVTALAYRVLQMGSSLTLPVDAGDFKLLSQQVVQHLLRLPESDPYLRGLVVWVGFTQAFVQYERAPRHAGRTHFPFLSRGPWKTFLMGLTSFSFLPVYLCGALAALGFVASFLLLATAGLRMLSGASAAGMLAIAGGIAFLWASTVASVAIVGLYVIRIYKDVRRRPLYIVRSAVGISAEKLAAHAALAPMERTE